MKNQITLPQHIRDLAEDHFVMLKRRPGKKKIDTLELNLHGYADIMYLIGNITKVCILALDSEEDHTRIPQSYVNISGVLEIILDLIPYEEIDLLDKIREAVLYPVEEEFHPLDIYLVMPESLREEMEASG